MKGDVRLRVEGLLMEKLIERASAQGIRLSRIVPEGPRSMLVETSDSDASHLLALCEKYSIPARIVSRRGGSALARWIRGRWTLGVGVLLGILLVALFLSRIWFIDVTFDRAEERPFDGASLRRALYAMGVHPGMPGDIDTARLSDELSAVVEGFSHVSAKREGVRLAVEAVPEVAAPEVYQVDAARDLYAAFEGVVESINVESGEACVKPGDVVRPGQTLILGEERAAGDGTRGVSAKGQVMLRAWYEGQSEGTLHESRLEYTGRASVSARLDTPWISVPIAEGERFDACEQITERIPIGGLFLPVSVIRTTSMETRSRRVPVDIDALKVRLSALALADARARLTSQGPAAYEVRRAWIRYTTGGDALRAAAVYEIYANAAQTREEVLKGGSFNWKTNRFTIPNA